MEQAVINEISSQQFLDTLLPPEKSDQFFEALYGDAQDGAYDISLEFISAAADRIVLAFNLVQRPGKCLVCSLTYGLPKVFSRHPVIDIKGMMEKIETTGVKVKKWQLGSTEENSSSLHLVPLFIDLES